MIRLPSCVFVVVVSVAAVVSAQVPQNNLLIIDPGVEWDPFCDGTTPFPGFVVSGSFFELSGGIALQPGTDGGIVEGVAQGPGQIAQTWSLAGLAGDLWSSGSGLTRSDFSSLMMTLGSIAPVPFVSTTAPTPDWLSTLWGAPCGGLGNADLTDLDFDGNGSVTGLEFRDDGNGAYVLNFGGMVNDPGSPLHGAWIFLHLEHRVDSGPTNLSPAANAGPDQTVHLGDLVTLDGSGSSDPDGDYPLAFAWTLAAQPSSSTASLLGTTLPNPTFNADALGDYQIELVVTDSRGGTSVPDAVTISTFNTAPTADAGADQAIIQIGTTVSLDGSQSFDLDGDPFTYAWTLSSRPVGSTATLDDPTLVGPSFVADVHGDYVVDLVVTDLFDTAGVPDSVTVSFDNVQPVADSGVNQSVVAGDTVFLDGSGSADANLDPLTYVWSLVSAPIGSSAAINGSESVQTSFVADLPGTYIVSLVVNDGLEASAASNTTIVAISVPSAATDQLVETINTINGLDLSVLKNNNMQNALTNKINAALGMVDQGDYQQALDKLQNDILTKTNGCAESGNPDPNDWIEDCVSQGEVYPLVIEAIGLLERLI